MKTKQFTIDFFELLFLAESVIPQQPIARSMCFVDFSEVHYHNMSTDQRIQFFNHVTKNPRFDIKNELCRHFYARFNPENQYEVKVDYNNNLQLIHTYLFDGKCHIKFNQFIAPEYIKEIKPLTKD